MGGFNLFEPTLACQNKTKFGGYLRLTVIFFSVYSYINCTYQFVFCTFQCQLNVNIPSYVFNKSVELMTNEICKMLLVLMQL